jgi:hypothetical protein
MGGEGPGRSAPLLHCRRDLKAPPVMAFWFSQGATPRLAGEGGTLSRNWSCVAVPPPVTTQVQPDWGSHYLVCRFEQLPATGNFRKSSLQGKVADLSLRAAEANPYAGAILKVPKRRTLIDFAHTRLKESVPWRLHNIRAKR